MAGKNGAIVIETRPESLIRISPSEVGGGLAPSIAEERIVPTISDGSGYLPATPNILDFSPGSSGYATRLFTSIDANTAASGTSDMTFSPSGIHLKPDEGTALVAMLDDRYLAIAKALDDDPSAGDWRINNPRVVLNIQHWETPPEDLEALKTDLQQWADDYGMTVCLKWKDTHGPNAEEFEPAGQMQADEAFAAAGDDTEVRLLEELKVKPDNAEALQVYADLLIKRHDPFGELILLQTSPKTPEISKRIMEVEKLVASEIGKELKTGEVTVSSNPGPVLRVTVKGARPEEVECILEGQYGLWIHYVTVVDPNPEQFGPRGTSKGWFGDETRFSGRVNFGFSRHSSTPELSNLYFQYTQEMHLIERAFTNEPSDTPEKTMLQSALETVSLKASDLSVVLGYAMYIPSALRGLMNTDRALNYQPMPRDKFLKVMEYAVPRSQRR